MQVKKDASSSALVCIIRRRFLFNDNTLILTLVILTLSLQVITVRYLWKSHAATTHDGERKTAPILALESFHQQQKHDTIPSEYFPFNRQDWITDLPTWIQNYVDWHREMRNTFPGNRLFDDPEAPKLLIRTCLGLCGGLNDRLGQLPWDLYLANQTGRVLLLHWHRPVPLEHFLTPNVLDWSVPGERNGFFSEKDVRVSRDDLKVVRSYQGLFQGYESDRPTEEFWDKHLDEALTRAKKGALKDVKLLRLVFLGHLNEDRLEQRLLDLGETDMIHGTETFGKIFWLFFRPSFEVQEELDKVFRQLRLGPGTYSAVHCRVRHPKATPKGTHIKGKNEDYPADKTGLPWVNETRAFAIETATKALRCAQTILQSEKEPIYFLSDSNDLVRFMGKELRDPQYLASNAAFIRNSKPDSEALEVVQRVNLLARDMTMENAHIDKQKGRDPPAYYATFVDLFLTVFARCVTYGIGYYAVFASKISGTTCKLLYEEEQWGGSESKRLNSRQCQLPRR